MYNYLILGLVAAHSVHSAAPCTPATFNSIIHGHGRSGDVNVNYAIPFPTGSSTFAPSPAFPMNATDLPELCGVSVRVTSSESSAYNFAVFLPTNWNNRILTTGNGGFNGGINYLDMATYSHYGFATVSTDTGHNSTAIDGSWALNEPEKTIDWGYRAMHGSVELAKTIVDGYYSNLQEGKCLIEKSYYVGCSTGGRQGLRETQLHPDSFDGVLAGAPAWWTNHLQTWTTYVAQQNLPTSKPGHVSSDQFAAYTVEFLKQCDSQDGVADQIVQIPYQCQFDYKPLSCDLSSANQSVCFDSAQADTLQKLLSPFTAPDGTFLFPGFAPGSDPGILSTAANPLGYGFLQWFVYNDTTWNYTIFSYKDVEAADRVNPGQATAQDFDISPFKNRGGKIIMYHGLADPLIPPGSSDYYYAATQKSLRSSDLTDFFRFFHIPGMGHCGMNAGTKSAPWYIAAAGQTIAGSSYGVPGFMDAKHDALLALMDWVENGTAPDEIVATKYGNDSVAGGVELQRPLCPVPKVATFDGSGEWHDAENWTCQ